MAALERIESVVREERIECDFERLDGYWFAEDPVALGAYFGARSDRLVDRLLGEQLETAAGTARPSVAPYARRSTARSACSRDCSPSNGHSAPRRR
jgi:hypothetical protein